MAMEKIQFKGISKENGKEVYGALIQGSKKYGDVCICVDIDTEDIHEVYEEGVELIREF